MAGLQLSILVVPDFRCDPGRYGMPRGGRLLHYQKSDVINGQCRDYSDLHQRHCGKEREMLFPKQQLKYILYEIKHNGSKKAISVLYLTIMHIQKATQNTEI